MGARRGAVAGLAGSAAAMVGAAAVHTLAPSIPFLPLALAQTLVRATPGGVATTFIDLLGHWALRVAVIGTLLGFMAAGAGFGLLIGPLQRRITRGPQAAAALAFVPLWVGIVWLSPIESGSVGRGLLALAALVPFAAAALTAGRVLDRLTEARKPPAPGPSLTGVTRRVVLRSLWWGAAGAVLGGANLGRILRPKPNPGRLMLHLSQVSPASTPSASSADRAFDAIQGLTPEVTPNADFYVVDEEIIDPDIDPKAWRLTVGGVVGRPVRIGYDELLRFPAVERYQTLECISNEVGGELISNAMWSGIPLRLILDRAGVDPTRAVEVVFRAVGGYSDSLSIDQAMDESTLIAVGMNGHVLPREHGFPARVLSVGTYGMKNPKWLTRIDVVDRAYTGYWEYRGWSKRAIVKTESRIDVPADGRSLTGPVDIAGIAFAGDRGISRVEVSTDGGTTWQQAELKRALSKYTWRLWRFRWTPPPSLGRSVILVRAYDGKGVPQAAARAQPHPDGSSGYDGIQVSRAATAG